MKRFHAHITVKNLDESLQFYRQLFGCEPTVQKADYAKWMLEDPRINFAISTRATELGINHLGIQVDSEAELAEVAQRARATGLGSIDDTDATCCYALSNKHWVSDPQGIIWEAFHTLSDIPVYGREVSSQENACCAPPMSTTPAQASACGIGGGCC